MMTGRYVEFPNQEGLPLRGILHCPDKETEHRVCVLLLSPGIKGRVGPHRLYLKLANRLVSRGFHVLRFDYSGLGDSAGEISERMLVDVYTSIQTGRNVGDTIAAMDWMQRTHGIKRFIGSGLCGGSISALLAAETDSRIESLLGIGLPTVLEGGPENWARILTQQQLVSLRGAYLRKLANPRSWLRFLAGKSDIRSIWRVMKNWAFRTSRPRKAPNESPPKAEVDNTNPRFAGAFLAILRSRRPVLLVFSGADRLHAQFRENFEAHQAVALASLRNLYEVHVVRDANHVLSDPAWLSELLQVAEQWLNVRYQTRPSVAP